MTSSVSLSSRLADILFDTACMMLRDNSPKKSIKDVEIEGRVTTSFRQQNLGSVAGVEFYAEVETELGEGKVKFMVRDADAEMRNQLEWAPLFSIEDVIMDIDSLPSRRSPMFN